jgi:hypothetical protein
MVGSPQCFHRSCSLVTAFPAGTLKPNPVHCSRCVLWPAASDTSADVPSSVVAFPGFVQATPASPEVSMQVAATRLVRQPTWVGVNVGVLVGVEVMVGVDVLVGVTVAVGVGSV